MKPIIAGNWKMNKTIDESILFLESIKNVIPDDDKSTTILCPPFTSLFAVSKLLKNYNLSLGAQNVHYKTKGAFTGEVSIDMLISTFVEYVILGHSERRKLFGESNSFIKEKVSAVVNAGLTPILCVGEEIDDRLSDKTQLVLKRQIESAISKKKLINKENLIIAYEPIWAIGTGETATTDQVEDAHTFIKLVLKNIFGNNGQNIPIIYGGSVHVDNAKSLILANDVDGFLIGGASLVSESFCEIIEIVSENYNRG